MSLQYSVRRLMQDPISEFSFPEEWHIPSERCIDQLLLDAMESNKLYHYQR